MVNVSLVLYHPDEQQVSSLVDTLLQAKRVRKVFLIDNSPISSENLAKLKGKVKYIWNKGKNLGYGAAHNIAIRESVYWKTAFHLVMNADIEVKAEDIDILHDFIAKQPAIGSLMPKVVYPSGETQYLCKLLPTPLDVFGRRFLPQWLIRRRNERYELRDSGYNKLMNVPYLSGCFMFLRTEAVLKARLFDERYFMYPEDVDLTRTIHRDYLTVFFPDVTIVHHHAKESYKNKRLLWIHIINMCRYFNKWGWIFDRERRLFNQLTLADLHKNTQKMPKI
ncbi:MAG: glycosyltransferase [Paludibacteraceae bacterium]|nr:glycosyltransferase [Paludibacteraceae bacterium]